MLSFNPSPIQLPIFRIQNRLLAKYRESFMALVLVVRHERYIIPFGMFFEFAGLNHKQTKSLSN